MANWCNISMEITATTGEDADMIYDVLQQAQAKAENENYAVLIGSKSRYLFEIEFDRCDKRINVYGFTRGALQRTEAVEWIQWFNAQSSITGIDIRYEECSIKAFGHYLFDRENVINRYLPSKYFLRYDVDHPDDWFPRLEEALEKHGINRSLRLNEKENSL